MSTNKTALERILETNEKVLELDLGGAPTDLVTVEEDGTFTVPVIEYTPTKEEKIAYIKKYYDERFATLDQALVRRQLINGDITDLQEQCKQLNLEMVAKIKEIQ